MSALHEWLTESLSKLLDYCESHKLKPPYIFCVASPDGQALVMRVIPGRDPETLAERITANWQLPVSGLLLDQTGQALKLVVDFEGFRHESVQTTRH